MRWLIKISTLNWYLKFGSRTLVIAHFRTTTYKRQKMEQQDYLKRQIDQLGRILGKILADFIGLKNKGQIIDEIEVAKQTLKNEIDLDLENLINIPKESFVNTLKTQKNLTNDHMDKLAEILLIIADNSHESNKQIYERCLTIYEYLEKEENIYSLGRQWKIQRIKNVL